VTAATRTDRAALVSELAEVVGARHEARFMVDEVVSSGGPLDAAAVARARRLAGRRAAGEPLQYALGHWSFRTLDLIVDPRVLIPRPETEQVVEVALAEARRLHAACGAPLVVVDAGTGSGAIALSLAAELGRASVAEVWATDVSAEAVAVARGNLAALQSVSAVPLPPVEAVQGSWLDPLPDRCRGAVHLVVSNPPYVSAAEWKSLEAEVRAEPYGALVAAASSDGTPGLSGVEQVLVAARSWLAGTGAAVVELAPHQAGPALALARRIGFRDTSIAPDLSGRERALVARV
jgi:release factor glutamine methyltransferase